MTAKNCEVQVLNMGLVDYQSAFDMQVGMYSGIAATKLINLKSSAEDQKCTPNYLLFCQHPHVYTMGTSGVEEHLLADEDVLRRRDAIFCKTNRGGDITYHGPGQLVLYLILDLENFFADIHQYLRLLEEIVICTLQDFGICGIRVKGLTGVWVERNREVCKICAIGVKVSRWITMHGLALNVNTDMTYFDHIVPCGIKDKKVASMLEVLGEELDLNLVIEKLKNHTLRLFGMRVASVA